MSHVGTSTTGYGSRARPARGADVLVSARGVSMAFGHPSTPVVALQGIELDVSNGEFVVLLGPSGCGKSTLLRLFSHHLTPTAGKIEFHGLRANMVFQEHGLFPWMKVIDNVAFGLRMRHVPKARRHERALTELKLVGLDSFKNAFPAQLSGGMKQRANIARAFANDPDLILMDEPYAALDVQTRTLMQEQLTRLLEIERRTVIFVTHSIEEALLLGDRVVIMGTRPGRIKREIQVPFERPRDIHALKRDLRFIELNDAIWQMISAEVKDAFERGL